MFILHVLHPRWPTAVSRPCRPDACPLSSPAHQPSVVATRRPTSIRGESDDHTVCSQDQKMTMGATMMTILLKITKDNEGNIIMKKPTKKRRMIRNVGLKKRRRNGKETMQPAIRTKTQYSQKAIRPSSPNSLHLPYVTARLALAVPLLQMRYMLAVLHPKNYQHTQLPCCNNRKKWG